MWIWSGTHRICSKPNRIWIEYGSLKNLVCAISEINQIGSESDPLRIGLYLDGVRMRSNHYWVKFEYKWIQIGSGTIRIMCLWSSIWFWFDLDRFWIGSDANRIGANSNRTWIGYGPLIILIRTVLDFNLIWSESDRLRIVLYLDGVHLQSKRYWIQHGSKWSQIGSCTSRITCVWNPIWIQFSFGQNVDRIGYESHRFQFESHLDRIWAIKNVTIIILDCSGIGFAASRIVFGWFRLQANRYWIKFTTKWIHVGPGTSWVRAASVLNLISFGKNADRIGYESHRCQIEFYLDRMRAIKNVDSCSFLFQSNRIRIGSAAILIVVGCLRVLLRKPLGGENPSPAHHHWHACLADWLRACLLPCLLAWLIVLLFLSVLSVLLQPMISSPNFLR